MADCNPMPRTIPGPNHCSQDPLSGLALAIAYVPWQEWSRTFELEKALQCGTIFPELTKPFCGKRGGCR